MELTWWLWMIAGLALFLVEVVTPGGFFVFFFGIGAMVVAFLSALGIAGPAWMQWLLFGLISTVSLLAFRKPLQQRMGTPDKQIDTMIGEDAIALVQMGIDGIGKAELRGTVWTARNAGPSVITAGQRCRVQRVEGLTLHLQG